MRLVHLLWRDVRANVWDYVVTGATVGVAIIALVTRIDVEDNDAHQFHPDTGWGWALTIAVCVALVGRRRWPLRSLAIGLVLVLLLELTRQRDSIAFFATLIAFYSVAAYLPRRLAWRGVAMMAALYVALNAGGTTVITTAPLIGPVLLATSFALGRMLRRSRTRQERDVEAAIERAADAVETAELQAADERLRMAQELHDVVAHSLSVIAVQAGIGVHLIDRQPAEAARALDAIRTTSHTAAGELTRLVDTLRDGGSADHASAPGLTDVTVLVEQVRTAGVPITLTTNGDLAIVPSGVSLAAYRIVQEALTNVVRHAGRAEASVIVRVTDDHVDLCVDDDGRGTTTLDRESSDGGHGLIGMGERAEMYGGEFRSGPRPGGGFRVQATLPYFASPMANEASARPTVDSTDTHVVSPTRRFPSWMWDVALAVLIAGLATVEIIGSNPSSAGPQFRPTHLWAWLLRIGCCLTLALRRRFPTTSLAVIWILGIALAVGDYQVGVVIFAPWIGVYTVASCATTRRLIAVVIGAYAAVAVIAWSDPPDLTVPGAVWIGVLFTATAIAGHVAQRDRTRRATDLAEREDAADARSRRARLVIATERLRIADELSMIIARSIHTIAREAGEGSTAVDLDPVAARKTLEAISAISRDALNDLRRLLKRMRTENDPAMYAPVESTLAVAAGAGQ